MKPRLSLAALAFAAALACGDSPPSVPPPADRFYFPTGLALRHVPAGCTPGAAGCQTQLLVVSSNFDLRYDALEGGSLVAVDVGASLGAGGTSPLRAVVLGEARIGTFGGEVAIVDAATCPGWTGGAQALVPSRSQNALYRVSLGDDGALACGPGCKVGLTSSAADAYGVTVACGSFPAAADATPAPRALAFVTYLRAASAHGWLSQLDLAQADPAATRTDTDLGVSPTHSAVYDPVSTRLFVTSRFGGVGFSPLRWIELANPASPPTAVNLYSVIRGAELRGMALSSDRARGFVAVRIYDADAAVSLGGRPGNDLAGALAVLDLTPGPAGAPEARVLRVVPLDRGATEVRVLPRVADPVTGARRRDLVAVSAADDSTVTLYDDEAGEVAKVFAVCGATPGGDAGAPAPCDPGNPRLGRQPFGMAVEDRGGGVQRLFVGSFDRSWVNVIDVDTARPREAPATGPDGAPSWWRIGAER